ncbi:programmed cell death protein 2 isoform X2 [Eurytemora carolleeae]|uniref:programmed cell death protein 2 isoform X2 n=1 Tax=Eurytemora carolleeae TaxID=1294199 RepID=UPI000C77D43B|nr:programmed cell death protein 2 isoform X2 [Eurytemora carolleeae]|eukprot:XP_023327260.1 programmed cell death protein 2-like isoform X2 [Eurytemora affinis]
MSSKQVDLGFFNGDYPPWGTEKEFQEFELESRYFPSKIGGKPAWLDLVNLPTPDQLECKQCGIQTKFLLQIYSPDDKVPHGFHRTLYVFICVQNSCWNNRENGSPVIVLRNQLSRENRFYPADPPEEKTGWRTDIQAEQYGTLCSVCGCHGTKMCGRCKTVNYCSQIHQKLDWSKGHKKECQVGCTYSGPHHIEAFIEGLIEIEEEPEKKAENISDLNYPGVEIGEMVAEDISGAADEEFEEVEAAQAEDKASEKFNERIKRAPHQIVRYDRDGSPLLCSYSGSNFTPGQCSACSSDLSFEFQIMPQVLSLLNLGSDLEGGLDFGSIYIYTCSRSCSTEGYVLEQSQILDFDQTNIPLP